jgi:hypothetical protein
MVCYVAASQKPRVENWFQPVGLMEYIIIFIFSKPSKVLKELTQINLKETGMIQNSKRYLNTNTFT